jgi:hypothetical protein
MLINLIIGYGTEAVEKELPAEFPVPQIDSNLNSNHSW